MDAAPRATPLRPSVRYVPGSWVAFAGSDVWLLAEMAPGSAVVTACWEAIDEGAGVDHVLGIILREGLRSVPSFALAGRGDSGMRILVEGKARAEVRMPGADASMVTADGAPTWAERRVDGPIDLRLIAADTAAGAGAQPALPLSGGAVLAAELLLGGVEAEAPVRPVTLVPMPDPPIVAGSPPVAPSSGGGPRHAPTLDHISADVDMPSDLPPPHGRPVADIPPPATVLVPGLIESLPPWRPPDDGGGTDGEDATGEIDRAAAAPAWSPPAGPPADATGIAGLDGVLLDSAPLPPTLHRPAVEAPPAAPAPPVVPAYACPNQHLNPPYPGRCRVCGAPVPPQDAFTVPRPVLGVLNLSTGDMVPLDRDIVVGRAPFHPDASTPTRPHLVAVASPGNDISRSHVRISLDGWHVQVVDLGSINGTVVTLPGQAPVRLRAHDPFTIVPGTSISLADEVSARFDVARA